MSNENNSVQNPNQNGEGNPDPSETNDFNKENSQNSNQANQEPQSDGYKNTLQNLVGEGVTIPENLPPEQLTGFVKRHMKKQESSTTPNQEKDNQWEEKYDSLESRMNSIEGQGIKTFLGKEYDQRNTELSNKMTKEHFVEFFSKQAKIDVSSIDKELSKIIPNYQEQTFTNASNSADGFKSTNNVTESDLQAIRNIPIAKMSEEQANKYSSFSTEMASELKGKLLDLLGSRQDTIKPGSWQEKRLSYSKTEK